MPAGYLPQTKNILSGTLQPPAGDKRDCSKSSCGSYSTYIQKPFSGRKKHTTHEADTLIWAAVEFKNSGTRASHLAYTVEATLAPVAVHPSYHSSNMKAEALPAKFNPGVIFNVDIFALPDEITRRSVPRE